VLYAFERAQCTVFTVQEFIIFSFYIRALYQIPYERERVEWTVHMRKTMLILLAIQALEIIMDVITLTLGLTGRVVLKGLIYSWLYYIKLEREFVVLNQPKKTAKTGVRGLLSKRLI